MGPAIIRLEKSVHFVLIVRCRQRGLRCQIIDLTNAAGNLRGRHEYPHRIAERTHCQRGISFERCPDAKRDIDPFLDKIHRPVERDELNADFRMLCEELRDQGGNRLDQSCWAAQAATRSSGLRAKSAQCIRRSTIQRSRRLKFFTIRRSGEVVAGAPGEPPAYAGTDFIVAKDGRISWIYLFFDGQPDPTNDGD